MGTFAPELPANSGGDVMSDIAGMGSFFLDPPGAARRVHSRWFWIWPLIVFSIISGIASYLMIPIVQHVMALNVPPNTSPEQYQKIVGISTLILKITMFCSPLMIAFFYAIESLIMLAASAIFSVKATFGQLFNLIAGCSVIQMLSSIAGLIIIKSKGDISTQAELRPALGLDIFLPAGANKYFVAFIGYFSVFEIWWIVMLVLIFASAFKVSKAKAFTVILPLILLSLLWRVVFAR